MTDTNDVNQTFNDIVAGLDIGPIIVPSDVPSIIYPTAPAEVPVEAPKRKAPRVLKPVPKSDLPQLFARRPNDMDIKMLPQFERDVHLPVLEGLYRVQQLIEEGWTKDAMLTVRDGQQMVCLAGAVKRAYGSSNYSMGGLLDARAEERRCLEAIHDALPRTRRSTLGGLGFKMKAIFGYNDASMRTRRQVERVIRRAIRAERKRLAKES